MLHLSLLQLLFVLTASPNMLEYLRPLNAVVHHPAFASIPAADRITHKQPHCDMCNHPRRWCTMHTERNTSCKVESI
jgi:hypothetical protein